MAFRVKKRSKLTYYCDGDRPVLSALVTEDPADGDLKIYFAGLTGGSSARAVPGRDEVVSMGPRREIPPGLACWEKWLRVAGIAESLRDTDFIELHAFGTQPKQPNPWSTRPATRPSSSGGGRCTRRPTPAGSPSTCRPWAAMPAHGPPGGRTRQGSLLRVLQRRPPATSRRPRDLNTACSADLVSAIRPSRHEVGTTVDTSRRHLASQYTLEYTSA